MTRFPSPSLLPLLMIITLGHIEHAHLEEQSHDEKCPPIKKLAVTILAAAPLKNYFLMLTSDHNVYQLPPDTLRPPASPAAAASSNESQPEVVQKGWLNLNQTLNPVPLEHKWPRLWHDERFQKFFGTGQFSFIWFTEDHQGEYVCFGRRGTNSWDGVVYDFKNDELLDGYGFKGLPDEGTERVSERELRE